MRRSTCSQHRTSLRQVTVRSFLSGIACTRFDDDAGNVILGPKIAKRGHDRSNYHAVTSVDIKKRRSYFLELRGEQVRKTARVIFLVRNFGAVKSETSKWADRRQWKTLLPLNRRDELGAVEKERWVWCRWIGEMSWTRLIVNTQEYRKSDHHHFGFRYHFHQRKQLALIKRHSITSRHTHRSVASILKTRSQSRATNTQLIIERIRLLHRYQSGKNNETIWYETI